MSLSTNQVKCFAYVDNSLPGTIVLLSPSFIRMTGPKTTLNFPPLSSDLQYFSTYLVGNMVAWTIRLGNTIRVRAPSHLVPSHPLWSSGQSRRVRHLHFAVLPHVITGCTSYVWFRSWVTSVPLHVSTAPSHSTLAPSNTVRLCLPHFYQWFNNMTTASTFFLCLALLRLTQLL